jgi:hypothetical protein
MSIHRSFTLLLFLLGALHASAQTAEPAPLFEIPIGRYVKTEDGAVHLQRGVLTALAQVYITSSLALPPGTQYPTELYDRVLVASSAWSALGQIRGNPLANFVRTGLNFIIGSHEFFEVVAREDANVAVGQPVNLSTRGWVQADASRSLIGGFIIEGYSRRVLIRGVGPGLTRFGVTPAVADPYLTLFRGSLAYYFNDDWSTRPEAAEIVSRGRQQGAFALTPGSKDAAILVELEPGAYTVQLTAASSEAGIGLLEIYILP